MRSWSDLEPRREQAKRGREKRRAARPLIPRRRKLHIVRFAIYGKAHSFRCGSSPHTTRFAGLVRGPHGGIEIANELQKLSSLGG